MSTLSVWKFDSPNGAEDALSTLKGLSQQDLVTIHDAATVTWPEGKKKPKTRQLADMTGSGALGGAFWGLLFGVLFFVPLLGMALGAVAGAASASVANVGIDDEFIRTIREKVRPGTSALFVMTSGAVRDKIKDAFDGVQAELIHTNLSNEQDAQLREAFLDD